MMSDAIKHFASQFSFEPLIEQGSGLGRYERYLVCGMGGSHLAADIIKCLLPDKQIIVHSDYGLPKLPEDEQKNTLVILSSYSGNTEETISSFEQSQLVGLPMLVVSTGGELISMAKRSGVPFIELPNTGIQPRSALGFSLKALLKAMGEDDILEQSTSLALSLKPETFEAKGQELAYAIQGKVPVFYSTLSNKAVAYNWKIKMNETGKVPAFYNVLPELNHNEMNGFDYLLANEKLSKTFCFIFIRDHQDNDSNQKRFEILKKLLTKRDLTVHEVWLEGPSKLQAIFSNLLVADWLAFHTATLYGAEAEQVPMVEEFKTLMK